MSAGELPFGAYHRASSVGEGTYGSVVVVYNDDGEEFALKLFTQDNDENEEEPQHQKPLNLGAMREISILRLLRGTAKHFQCINLHDISPEWTDEDDDDGGGAGTSGTLGMAMPLFSRGSLGSALEGDVAGAATTKSMSKAAKAQVTHDILTAVGFLHAHGIVHRDIKSDNILLQYDENSQSSCGWRAVLIDMSLAKPVDETIYSYGNDTEHHDDPSEDLVVLDKQRHTGQIGTLLYNAPEVSEGTQEYYDAKAVDIWSVGVIVLELLLNQALSNQVTKAKQVGPVLKQAMDQLPSPNQPFPSLVHSLLQQSPDQRPTARQALENSLFAKFGLQIPTFSPRVRVATALPYDDDDDEAGGAVSGNRTKVLKKRISRIEQICQVLGSERSLTRQAALEYSIQMEQLDDAIDDYKNNNNSESQALLDCVVLAHRFFEVDAIDLNELEQENEEDAKTKKGVFGGWSLSEYIDFESTLFMLLDFCLYPRKLR